MIKKIKKSSKSKKHHKQSKQARSRLKEKAKENWCKCMKSSKVKRMSQGAQNIARMIKTGSGFGKRTVWGKQNRKKA